MSVQNATLINIFPIEPMQKLEDLQE